MKGEHFTYLTDESKKEELFAKEFPHIYNFVVKEKQFLDFAAELSLCYQDEESCRLLNKESEELSIAISFLCKRYSMDLFE
ncbi:hypothetical protein [Tenacibaculum agarivorans]|uniref:hypothetical protein n=1 Tax=Tenacibaculum agarivorans TaxID=1908389 RepID=UPI00094BA743|nr:hypothetical protein [Tenacibaculum agarivorans]